MRWKRVTEDLPREDCQVLVVLQDSYKNQEVKTGVFYTQYNQFVVNGNTAGTLTHWSRLTTPMAIKDLQ